VLPETRANGLHRRDHNDARVTIPGRRCKIPRHQDRPDEIHPLDWRRSFLLLAFFFDRHPRRASDERHKAVEFAGVTRGIPAVAASSRREISLHLQEHDTVLSSACSRIVPPLLMTQQPITGTPPRLAMCCATAVPSLPTRPPGMMTPAFMVSSSLGLLVNTKTQGHKVNSATRGPDASLPNFLCAFCVFVFTNPSQFRNLPHWIMNCPTNRGSIGFFHGNGSSSSRRSLPHVRRRAEARAGMSMTANVETIRHRFSPIVCLPRRGTNFSAPANCAWRVERLAHEP